LQRKPKGKCACESVMREFAGVLVRLGGHGPHIRDDH